MLNRTEEVVTGCFVGTQVLTGDGSSKAIEEVRAGDEVVAADPSTGEITLARSLRPSYTSTSGFGESKPPTGLEISTSEYPFFVQGKGWVSVRELMPGDSKGSEVSVAAVSRTGDAATVYNLHVDQLHVYHVQSDRAWIRVHNACPRGDDLRGV